MQNPSLSLTGNVNKTGERAPEQPRRYPSRIDGVLIVALAGVPAALMLALAGGVLALPAVARAVVLLAMGCLFGLLLWTFAATHYSIDADSLTVRSGPMRWVIALSQIESVTPTRDARSGPALSLDRLCIRYDGGREMLISPREKDAFLRDLESARQKHAVPGQFR